MPPFQQYCTLFTDRRGYEYWTGSEIIDDKGQVYVHRLVAVAEHGFDDVSNAIVHHKNGVPWDNRPENLEVMTQSEHVRRHHKKLTWLDRLRVTELYADGEISQPDLGQEFDVDGSTISRTVAAVKERGTA